ncbi:MAG: dienelactone hydrolase family protein [Thermaerobacter sp.]|nr:dienelactone hydrolase family protein [Thermaerobacter sp.]
MQTKEVRCMGRDREIDGYLALPEGDGLHPAIIVVHEIWGLDDHIRNVTRRFAEQGFVALAPDLYTGEWREAMQPQRIMAGMQFLRQAPPEIQRDPSRLEDALQEFPPAERTALRTLMRVMRPEQRSAFAEDLLGALQFLQQTPGVDPARIACLGFCMGGGITGQVATKAQDLWRAVIFYGENPPLEAVPKIRAEVLGLYGGEDPRITDTVPQLAKAMAEAGKEFTYRVFPGAPHAFFNDSREATYRPLAAADAWAQVLSFLD